MEQELAGQQTSKKGAANIVSLFLEHVYRYRSFFDVFFKEISRG